MVLAEWDLSWLIWWNVGMSNGTLAFMAFGVVWTWASSGKEYGLIA